MTTYPRDDETVVMPPVRGVAAPPTIDPQVAEIPERVRMMAAYDLDNGINPADVEPEVAAAMAALEADGYWLKKQEAAAQATAAPREDRSSWPRAVADGLANGSVVASVAGLFLGPCAILGIVLGALSASAAHKNKQRASTQAVWGIGLGAAFTALWVIGLILLISVLAAASAAISSYPTGY